MKRNVKPILATALALAMFPTSIFGAGISVSSQTAKQDTDVPFQVVLHSEAADIVKAGTVSISLPEGSFVTKDVKAFLGAKELKSEVSSFEKSILITFDDKMVEEIKKGEKIKVTGVADVDGLGEKKIVVDANGIGLGSETKVFATMTEEDSSFVRVLNAVPSIGYQRDSELAHFMISPKKTGEITLKLPSDVEWDENEMKKADRISGATFVSVDGRVLKIKGTENKNIVLKPVVDVDKDATKGNIEVSVESDSGKARAVIGMLQEYEAILEVVKGVKTEFEGKKNIPVTVELKSKGGRLPQTSYVDFKVINGEVKGEAINAKETGNKAKIEDNKGRAVDEFAFRTNDNGTAMKLNLEVTPKAGAKVVSLEARLRNADIKTDLVKLSTRVSVTADNKKISGGKLDEEVGSIKIMENEVKALDGGEIYGIKIESDKFGQVLFSKGAKIDSKNLTVKDLSLSKDEKALQFVVNKASAGSNKGEIALSDIKVSTQRTVAKGNYKAVFFKAVKPSSDLDKVLLADGKEYGVEVISHFDFFTVGEEPAPAPTPEPAPQPIPDIKQTKTIFKLGSSKYLDGEVEKQLTSPVYTKSGYTMLPMRVIAETLGVDVKWDNSTKIATFTKGDVVVKVKSNGTTLNRNGQDIKMNTPSENVKGSLFLPLSSLGDAFGLERGTGYVWVPETKQVIVMH